jgi:uncharacterized protein involved in outer membrane biogenesis
MKKKIILGIGIGLIVVIVAVVIIVGFFLGTVVKVGMETIGPKVTQTSLTVSSVQVGILSGSARINDLVLGNPEAYLAKAPDAISVGKTAVSVAPFSVLSDKIVIKSVEVISPEITFEGNPFGANNLKAIMNNVNAFSGGAGPDTNAPTQTGANKPAKKLEVDDFLISGAKVHFNGATLPLPDIHFSDLGTGPEGITAADLTKKVLGEISASTIKEVASSVGNAGKAVGSEAGKLGKSLGGLFGK